MAKKNDLKIALLLDLDQFAPGLKKARATAGAEGNAINATLGEVANAVTKRFLSVQAALHVAKKGYQEFVAKAKELEKTGQGNEGTAAIARISAAADRLWMTFVRGVTETKAFRVVIGTLAEGMESLAAHLDSGGRLLDLWGSGLKTVQAIVAGFLSEIARGVELIAQSLDKMGAPGAGGVADFAGELRSNLDKAQRAYEIEANKRFAGYEKGRTSSSGDAFDAEARRSLEAMLEREGRQAQSYDRASGGALDAFVGSWEGGLSRVADLFRNFSADVGASLGGLASDTVSALGDTVDGLSSFGSMAQKVWGQSAAGAKFFAVAEQARIGAVAAVNSALAFAQGLDAGGDGKAETAAAKFAASGAYAAAAGLAGVTSLRAAASGGRGASSGGIASSSQFGEERRTVTVVVQNAVGGEAFVRQAVIPEINRAVRGSVTVLSTAAQAANSLQPGRDF